MFPAELTFYSHVKYVWVPPPFSFWFAVEVKNSLKIQNLS